MMIHFELHTDTNCYFKVKAHLKITGHGVLKLTGDDYDLIPENLSKEEFIYWLYDTYFSIYNFDEYQIKLNEDDIEMSYSKYLNAQEEY